MWVYALTFLVLGSSRSAEIIKEEAPPFICIDGSQIALANVCDGRAHCSDSSDETTKLCHHVVCPKTSFRCLYGACISRSERCNGFADCLDGSDELFCDSDSECSDQTFRCSTSLECISNSLKCNGFKDCADGSDENATICKDYLCPEHTFQCSYGGCIHQEVVCDGIKDCTDGTDEAENLCASVNCKGDDCKKFACRNDEFSCESGGQCIPLHRLCDGTHQCRDASDEKPETCGVRSCPESHFRCAYGGCVPSSLVCNQKPDCHDWSDEAESLCNITLPSGACRLPLAKPATQYSVSGCEGCRPGDIVPEFTKLEFACQDEAVIEGVSMVHCQANRWLPALPLCSKADAQIKCPVIRSPGAKKRCEIRWGPEAGWTQCDLPLPIGSRVSLECRNELYERVRGSSHVTCLHDGTWSQTPLSCQPVCGIRASTSVALVVKGWNVPAEEPLPWHVTLFSHERGTWNFFCGGTLIAESVVLTAGHCVFRTKPETIKVVLASNSSNFAKQTEDSQVRDVDRIEIQDLYYDREGNYNSDMALLILKQPVTITSKVLPACIDWSNDFDLAQRKFEIGIVAGMGITENNTFSQTLRMVSGQVIPPSVCRAQVKRDFRKYLTYTSFCAGWANGTGVCNGDSGGGFLLQRPKSEIWDVHGVVSLSPRRLGAALCDPNYYTVFTKVSAYARWIKKIVESVPVPIEPIEVKSEISQPATNHKQQDRNFHRNLLDNTQDDVSSDRTIKTQRKQLKSNPTELPMYSQDYIDYEDYYLYY